MKLFLKYFSVTLSLLLLVSVFSLPLFASSENQTRVVESDYALPYPGLLPDNPLYVAKAIRDGIVRFFISDPKQKASFDLLQADKRLSAALMLSQQQHFDESLIIQTISKAENYFSYAIGEVKTAKSQGEEVNGLLDQLRDSSFKHEQVISGVLPKLSSMKKVQLQNELGRVTSFEKMVTDIRSK